MVYGHRRRRRDAENHNSSTFSWQAASQSAACTATTAVMCRVKNNLKQPASIHWHGILQRGTVIMDGVAGVTQRAIPESTSQLYNFICDLPGTYWVSARRGRRGQGWGMAGQGSAAQHSTKMCKEGPVGGNSTRGPTMAIP